MSFVLNKKNGIIYLQNILKLGVIVMEIKVRRIEVLDKVDKDENRKYFI